MERHPFDARRSGRDPFPNFDAAVHFAGSDSDNLSDSASGGGCACDGAATDCVCEAALSLNWSIDGLATLLPLAFSPLPHQKRTPWTLARQRRQRRWSTGTTDSLSSFASGRDALVTPQSERGSAFFDDEAQFHVLRTPNDVVERERMEAADAGSAYARWRAPNAARWCELHRRCADTIQFCEARLRERQLKLARLPIPATKLTLQRRVGSLPRKPHPRASEATAPFYPATATVTPVRGTNATARGPLTPVAPTRLSFGSIELSPIPISSAERRTHAPTVRNIQTSPAEPPTTPVATKASPVAQPPSGCAGSSVFSSPALSSIAEHAAEVLTPSFASLRFSPSRELDDGEQVEEKENKENEPSFGSDGVSSSSSLKTISLLRDGPESSSSASSSPFTPPSRSASLHASSVVTQKHRNEREEAAADSEGVAIARRQQSFIAAIEEEAQTRDAKCSARWPNQPSDRDSATEESESDAATDDAAARTTTTSDRRIPPPPPPPPLTAAQQASPFQRLPPPATSMASMYTEARALGITEPTAQWEYVQLISRQTNRTKTRLTL